MATDLTKLGDKLAETADRLHGPLDVGDDQPARALAREEGHRPMTSAARAAGIVAMIQRLGSMEPAEAAQAINAAIREAQDAALTRAADRLAREYRDTPMTGYRAAEIVRTEAEKR